MPFSGIVALPYSYPSWSTAQYTILQYKKENIPKLSQICNYGICSKGLKNEFETAMVNEPSVFEPLKFYCIAYSEKLVKSKK